MRLLRVHLATLGCKVNSADGEGLLARLHEFATLVPSEAKADLTIVNSCTVTAAADRQTRQLLYQARRRNPSGRLVLTGCFARVAPAQAASIEGVDRVFTLAEHDLLLHYARGLAAELGAEPRPTVGAPFSRGRPFLKIQDGCDRRCSYCIVPRARGPSRSLPIDEVLGQLRARAGEGFAELVLSGIHLGDYGRDLQPRSDLPTLLRRARELGPGIRIRLSSIEPDEVNDALVEEIRSGIVCPHLHLPVQSADDAILAAMNRPYRSSLIWELLARLRERIPMLALGMDLIAGFPGEGEEQFARSLELVERSPLTHLHVFPYSPRPETPAATLPGQVPVGTVRARVARLRAAGREKLTRFAAAQVGERRALLVERVDPVRRVASGTTENYLRATIPWPEPGDPRPGQLVPDVLIEAATADRLRGRCGPTTARA